MDILSHIYKCFRTTSLFDAYIFGDNCEHTKIVNELDVPVLAIGLKNIIIAASPEGILVSDNEASDYIKPYVDNIVQQIMFAEKSWGSFKVIDVDEESLTIKVTLNEGHSMHYHSHEYRDEVWTVIKGSGYVIIDDIRKDVNIGDVIEIKAGVKHKITAITDMQLIEVQTGKNIDVTDKIKFD